MRIAPGHFAILFAAAALSLAFPCGCERGGAERTDADQRADDDPASPPPSPWLTSPPPSSPSSSGGGAEPPRIVLPADDPELERVLAEASAKARETAPAARQRWLDATPLEKRHWLIKWAAPYVDEAGEERVEHVWVSPVNWSPFRIEGRLANQPRHDIGHALGDFVTFPVEQLSDWVYKINGDMAGPRQGGFTVDVLESRYGPPSRD